MSFILMVNFREIIEELKRLLSDKEMREYHLKKAQDDLTSELGLDELPGYDNESLGYQSNLKGQHRVTREGTIIGLEDGLVHDAGYYRVLEKVPFLKTLERLLNKRGDVDQDIKNSERMVRATAEHEMVHHIRESLGPEMFPDIGYDDNNLRAEEGISSLIEASRSYEPKELLNYLESTGKGGVKSRDTDYYGEGYGLGVEAAVGLQTYSEQDRRQILRNLVREGDSKLALEKIDELRFARYDPNTEGKDKKPDKELYRIIFLALTIAGSGIVILNLINKSSRTANIILNNNLLFLIIPITFIIGFFLFKMVKKIE